MLAVVISPVVCDTWAGWIIAECWGIALFKGVVLALPVAFACAALVRSRLVRVR